MDTRSKKFNSTLVFKIVAFLVCICCVLNCTSQAIIIYNRVEENNIRESTLEDAFGNWLNPDRETVYTNTFKRHVRNYTGLINTMTGRFGDGSEVSYEMWKNSLSASNEAFYKTAKENVINHIIADEFLVYLKLVEEGVVEPLGILTTAEYNGYSTNISTCEIEDYVISYHELCNNSDNVVKFTNDKNVQAKAEKLGADGVFELNKYYQIINDDDYDFEYLEELDKSNIIESYKPSFYAFKINDEALHEKLIDRDIYISDDYGSATVFAAEYKKYADTAKEEYPSGRYFIRDSSGRVYTNMDKLNSKSTQEEIKAAFDKLGFWCYDHNGDIYLPDGTYYNFAGTYYEDKIHYDITQMTAVTTTVTVAVPTQMQTTVINGEAVSVPVTQESTTQKPVTTSVNAYDETPFLNEGYSGSLYFIGVDIYGDYSETHDLFTSTEGQIRNAETIIEDALLYAGVLGTLFLVCFIYLIARAGRRSGDREIHLLKTDAIFVDWRIVIDVLAGWGLLALFVVAVEEFSGNERLQAFNIIVSVLAAVFTAVVIDLVLFITRHIKAGTLLKRLFPVWVIRKCFGGYKEKVKPTLDEKLLYTRHFSKGTLIRILTVVCVNLVLGFMGAVEAVNYESLVFFSILALFDIFAFIWFIRLIGGLQKIFSALDEIRQGNYEVYINTYAMPSTLRESAGKVMSLRDGLKNAVDEAVRQEQTKTELITNVSHDLKTPLTSIINYVELLKKCNINDADAKEYLDILGEKSDRLKKLIEDLVEASKASTGNINVELATVSLNEMVSQLLGEHSDGLEKRNLNVVVEMPENNLAVKADGKLLYRVMENLIVNVEKYSLYGTRVYVTVREENGYGTVIFKNVSEQPLNITADQLKARFVRGDESRSTEGNGLGLSIAESLCTVQGGELEISINGDLFIAKVRLKK